MEVQLNNGNGAHGREKNGVRDEVANIISNSTKSTLKKKNSMLAVEEENHEHAAMSKPEKRKKNAAAADEERDELNSDIGKGKQIPTEKSNSKKKQKKVNNVLCSSYPCVKDAIKEVCRTGGFGSSLMAELLRRIGDEKLVAVEKKFESHWANEMKLRAQLMELNAELHRLLISSVNSN